MKPEFLSARHPSHTADLPYWTKWRRVAEGGDAFVDEYLAKLPNESATDHFKRKLQTPSVSYVKMCIAEIIAAFMVRMPGVTRSGGDKSFIEACAGKNGGIDGFGSTMNRFISEEVLRELLTVKRVGIYVDRAVLPSDISITEAKQLPPYCYVVRTEDILAWTTIPGSLTPSNLLLRESIPVYAPGSDFIISYTSGYRHMYKVADTLVAVDRYDKDGNKLYSSMLDLPRLPFILLEVSGPAVQDAAGAQIALLNLESSSVTFAIETNLTVYTEQGDMTTMLAALRRSAPRDAVDEDGDYGDEDEDIAGGDGDVQTIRLGRNRGRRYLRESERPGFVEPDNSNLQRAVSLASSLKEDIRRMMMLAVANVTAKAITSATALIQGQVTANNGLATLGALFESAERTMALIWAEFQQETGSDIIYPSDFQILTDEERRTAIKELADLRDTVPSKQFQIEVTSKIARLLLSPTVTAETLQIILDEIKKAPALMSRVDDIVQTVEASIMPREYAAQCLCLPADAAKKANLEHAERLRRISASQEAGNARGNTDGADTADDEKELSQDPDLSDSGSRAVRS